MKIILRSPFGSLFTAPHKLQYYRALSHFPKNEEKQKHQKNDKNDYKEKFTSKSVLLGAATTSLLAYYYLVNEKQQRYAYAAKKGCGENRYEEKTPSSDIPPNPYQGCHRPGVWRLDLPTYTREDVAAHDVIEKRVWVSYKEGVYDITDYIRQHPGGPIVMMAAGGPLEPFWTTYGLHVEKSFIMAKFDKMRIGNLCKTDQVKVSDYDDPYINQPERCNKDCRTLTTRPYNGGVRLDYLANNFITPVKWFYVRNHLPVPDIDANEHTITLEVAGTDKKLNFSMDEIKKMRKVCKMITLMCDGNNRDQMIKVAKENKAINWGPEGASNGVWTGVKLCDLLEKVGITEENYGNYKHVQFEGVDQGVDGEQYNVSIPIWKAVDKKGDVLVAYFLNGEPLTRDHGYPARIVVPGYVGARSCKWLTKIIVSENEASGHSQVRDNKLCGPSVRWDNVDFENTPALLALPVYSMICKPLDNDRVQVVDGYITIKGYAYAGGGNKIVRVDVTSDCGKTWQEANLDFQDKSDFPHHWAWTIWSCKIPIEKNQVGEVEVWCKAVDTSSNSQPESFEHIYNIRGVICHAYHKIKVKVTC